MKLTIRQRFWIKLAGVLAFGCPSALGEFQITAVHLTDGSAIVVLEFTSLAGMSHRVEKVASLGSGTWADAGLSLEGDGGIKRFEIPIAGQGGNS